MESIVAPPLDLPTLRNHHSYYKINNKRLPILYRLKSGVYYPYIAFELIADELDAHCSSWSSSKTLPLLPMTINERILYKNLHPHSNFTSSSTLILCSIIDQLLQLVEVLRTVKSLSTTTEYNEAKHFGRFTIDIQCGSIQEIDVLSAEATTRYNHLRSTHFLSVQNVKKKLCFDDENSDLSTIGGYLQLDRCIYPYIITSSDILLNLNDLRKPFNSVLNRLMPYFNSQPVALVNNYIKIVECGTRSIKNYKYYYREVNDKFISLYRLLLCHGSFHFVQLFNTKKTSLRVLHEHYRADFSNLLKNNMCQMGYLNKRPCIGGWSLFDPVLDGEKKSRLATQDETLLINWLLIYDNQCFSVHHQVNDLILVKQEQQTAVTKENFKFVQDDYFSKRALLFHDHVSL